MKQTKNKKPYQSKFKNKPRSTSVPHTFKKLYEDPPCKKCNAGVLRPTQWNRIICSNVDCKHSELA